MLLEKIVSILALSATLAKGGMDVAIPDKNVDGSLFLVNREHTLSAGTIFLLYVQLWQVACGNP